jgi:hypothetical protein
LPSYSTAYGDGFERVGVIRNAETGLGRRKRHRMRGVGAAMHHAPSEFPHDLLAACHHGDRIAVGHRLGESADIGIDARWNEQANAAW